MDNVASLPALIEIGWIIDQKLQQSDREAVEQARHVMQVYLQQTFTAFTWHIASAQCQEAISYPREEPVVLLEYGINERQIEHWDFAFLITATDLLSHYKPYALGAPSRSVSVAILSIQRLAPKVLHVDPTENRRALLVQRIQALALRLFGHLNGLSHHDAADSYMYDFQTVGDLDNMQHFTASHMAQMFDNLREVADVRLEESSANRPSHPVWFAIRSMWIGREEIGSAVMRAKPWEFPFRLSRLTTAAISALLILLMTAEVWDVGMQQSVQDTVGLALGVLILASMYILKRQQLLTRRHIHSLSEQNVFTYTAINIVVVVGMCTTYVFLFSGAFLLGVGLFPPRVISGWVGSLPGPVSVQHYGHLAAFVASLALLIGALGASFEQQYYFRHITYIDEET